MHHCLICAPLSFLCARARCVCVCACVSVCVCMCVCVCVCVCVCTFIYIHVYIHTDTPIHTRIHILSINTCIYIQANTPQSEAPSNALPSQQAGARGMADGGSPVLRASPVRAYAERPKSPVLLSSGSPVRGSPVRARPPEGYAEVQKMPSTYGLMMEEVEVLFYN
jgi:hypothetical protein